MWLQPSARTVGTPHPGQHCTPMAASAFCTSSHVRPGWWPAVLHLKHIGAPQHGDANLG